MVCYISRESGVLDVGSLRNGRLEISGSFAGSEAITGVTCGSIWPNSQNNNGGSDSILFSTFSGRICTLESRISFKPSDMQSQIALLKSECEQLEKEVAMAKEKMVHLPKPGANFSVPVPKVHILSLFNCDKHCSLYWWIHLTTTQQKGLMCFQ
jgi:hypothetical protein